ncbi:MAG: transcriptional repressor [Actinobacteria bacterium]|nr:MAG: transcriptional repressor [Actinomycetota bacterium]
MVASTHGPATRDHADASADADAAALRSAGFRVTRPRMLLLAAVRRLRHATPEELLAEVHTAEPGINLSTVYRALGVLDQVGLITHAHIGSGAPTYHPSTTPAHLHFRCQRCGRLQSLPPSVGASFVADVHSRIGFAADLSHAAIRGLCCDCTGAVHEGAES